MKTFEQQGVKMKNRTIKTEDTLWSEIKKLANQKGMMLNSFVIKILQDFVNKNK